MLLVFSMGCSKNNKPTKSKTTTTQTEEKYSFKNYRIPVDPVSKKIISKDKIKYTLTYKDVKYYFESEENMKKFKSNPSKYIGK